MPSSHEGISAGATQHGHIGEFVRSTGDKLMTSKVPPVPPQNRSPKGTGDPKERARDQVPRGKQGVQNVEQNVEGQGEQGNIKQNTTNQGYQQDR
jgi:hypothetical protein